MDINDLDKLNKRELLDLCEKHKLTKYYKKDIIMSIDIDVGSLIF